MQLQLQLPWKRKDEEPEYGEPEGRLDNEPLFREEAHSCDYSRDREHCCVGEERGEWERTLLPGHDHSSEELWATKEITVTRVTDGDVEGKRTWLCFNYYDGQRNWLIAEVRPEGLQ